jgi:hypothetical protein
VLSESHRDGIGNIPVDPPDSGATAYFGQHLGTSSIAQPGMAVLSESHRDGIGNIPVDPPDSGATAYFGQHLGTSSIAQPGMAVLPKGQTA